MESGFQDFGPITVHGNLGRAAFERNSPSSASFTISYDTPEQDVFAGSSEEAVSWACSREIAHMRRALTDLGVALASRLSAEGSVPHVERSWENSEKREWKPSADGLRVAASTWTSQETLEGSGRYSDRHLVLNLVTQAIHQRQENIKDAYAKILLEIDTATPALTEPNRRHSSQLSESSPINSGR